LGGGTAAQSANIGRMRRDLTLVVALACLALAAALFSAPVWLRAPLLVPLVLVLPGYALAAILFPLRTISPAERGVYAVGLSIAVAAVGGLLIQLVVGLDRDIWAAFLALVTIAAGVRGPRGGNRGRMTFSLAKMPRSLPIGVAVFLAAAVIAGMAIASAGDGLRDAQAKIHFTDFWLLPGDAGPRTQHVSIGLHSHEGRTAHYTVRLSREGLPLATESLTLRAGEQWEQSFAVTKIRQRVPVLASLSRDGLPYRSLDFVPSR
jgi:uncharacterized membrane protein